LKAVQRILEKNICGDAQQLIDQIAASFLL
jgi:hypothetical protein